MKTYTASIYLDSTDPKQVVAGTLSVRARTVSEALIMMHLLVHGNITISHIEEQVHDYIRTDADD